MKVKELLEILNLCDPEAIVIMSRDAEGNGYSPLNNIGEDLYEAETSRYGDLADDRSIDAEEAVVFWPLN